MIAGCPSSRVIDWTSLDLVAGCTFARAVGYHFSTHLVKSFPRAFIIFKAVNQSSKIVVRGLHIVRLRSLPVPAWLVQSSMEGVGSVRELIGEIRNV